MAGVRLVYAVQVAIWAWGRARRYGWYGWLAARAGRGQGRQHVPSRQGSHPDEGRLTCPLEERATIHRPRQILTHKPRGSFEHCISSLLILLPRLADIIPQKRDA